MTRLLAPVWRRCGCDESDAKFGIDE